MTTESSVGAGSTQPATTKAAPPPRPHQLPELVLTDQYENALDDDMTLRIAHILRVIFPHDRLGEGPYERSAAAIVTAARTSNRSGMVLVEGVRSLDGLVGGDFGSLGLEDAAAVLRHVEQTQFFQLLLTSAVVTLYSDRETWELLGYEGPSFDQGGYINRGFNDLDWLPEPRIEEYDGDDKLVEYVPAVPGMPISFDQTKKVATI